MPSLPPLSFAPHPGDKPAACQHPRYVPWAMPHWRQRQDPPPRTGQGEPPGGGAAGARGRGQGPTQRSRQRGLRCCRQMRRGRHPDGLEEPAPARSKSQDGATPRPAAEQGEAAAPPRVGSGALALSQRQLLDPRTIWMPRDDQKVIQAFVLSSQRRRRNKIKGRFP